MPVKALPCPFCGSARIGCHLKRSGRKSGYQCMCLQCGIAQTGSYYDSPDQAASFWNKRGAAVATPTEPGWTIVHPKYGTWFISRAVVAQDWQLDFSQSNQGAEAPEPDAETIDTWFHEQISWATVAENGRQIAPPDMESLAQSWLADMRKNGNEASLDCQSYAVI